MINFDERLCTFSSWVSENRQMLRHFWKKLMKLSTKEVVKDHIKSDKQEDTPMSNTIVPIMPIKKLSGLSISLASISTTSLSSMTDMMGNTDMPSRPSMIFDSDVWLIEE